MFIIKKIVTPFLIPPGLFIILLWLLGYWLFRRKNRIAGITNFIMGLFIWFLSISPVSDAMLNGLEYKYPIPKDVKGDVIIVLGGGANSKIPDISGIGVPSEEMLSRMVTAVRLQKRLNVPIIIFSLFSFFISQYNCYNFFQF